QEWSIQLKHQRSLIVNIVQDLRKREHLDREVMVCREVFYRHVFGQYKQRDLNAVVQLACESLRNLFSLVVSLQLCKSSYKMPPICSLLVFTCPTISITCFDFFDRCCKCFRKINMRSEEHTSELQSRFDLVCRLLLEKKNQNH